MKFDFDQIPEDGLNIELTDTSWLPLDFSFDKPSFATAVCRKEKSGSILVKGHYKAVAVLVCDRCLEEFKFPLNIEFNLYVEVLPIGYVREDNHHCKKTEMDTFYVEKPELDLSYLFWQQVILSMPMKRLCSKDCRGLCKNCGINLNTYPEECRCEEESDSPFRVLARIKKVE